MRKNDMKKLSEMKKQFRQQRTKKSNNRPNPEQVTKMIVGQMDQDRARVNQIESHLLNLDRMLQEYVRNISGEIQSLRAENEDLKKMLETILDIFGEADEDEEKDKEK